VQRALHFRPQRVDQCEGVSQQPSCKVLSAKYLQNAEYKDETTAELFDGIKGTSLLHKNVKFSALAVSVKSQSLPQTITLKCEIIFCNSVSNTLAYCI
jgi:hypothetical protein